MISKHEIEEKKKMRSACCDIFHGEDSVILKLEMPGVPKNNLDIKVDNDRLIITGRKEQRSRSGEYLSREIRQGDFYQEFTLDDTIDKNNIDATVKNGVVTLILSIKESVKPRKIEINAG
ncbi:MAG: Hsp20/alpha crystallin family protein [Spirochaetales bacterium]|nr:Hsp20/alpha crystallin family protein [Spirochaetales bacterium]